MYTFGCVLSGQLPNRVFRITVSSVNAICSASFLATQLSDVRKTEHRVADIFSPKDGVDSDDDDDGLKGDVGGE